jgi:uncharacterized sulfatase
MGLKIHKCALAVFSTVLFVVLYSCNNPSGESSGLEDALPVGTAPNILFVISDDQSYPHASAYGSSWVNTPNFDRIAKEGVLFTNAFSASPGCSPSRAAILTGMNCWQLENAGTHASEFPAKFKVFPDILEELGYKVGYTQKGWGPGNWKISGRSRNPAGEVYNSETLTPPTSGIKGNDYSANFKKFMDERENNQPFYFWFGASEPHRVFEKGSGLKAGKDPGKVIVPGFLPDTPEIRSDLLDYALEIEWYDQHLGKMLDLLEENGELDNTLIIVTADNGMAFPSAKANVVEYGVHVPLAIRWGNQIINPQVKEDLVSLVDIAPTILEAVGENSETSSMEGRSLISSMTGSTDASMREEVFTARERHSSSRWNNLTYPQRGLRTEKFLYVRNFKPERWPAGAPQKFEKDGSLGPMHGAYTDIDACPTFDFMVENRDVPEFKKYFEWAVARQPGEQFFDIETDPFCLKNLAYDPNYEEELLAHRRKMGAYLMETADPRVTGSGDIYEAYVRFSSLRQFPEPDWLVEKSDTRLLTK